jgi:uncharacterized membrane protein
MGDTTVRDLDRKERLVPTLMVAGVVSLLLGLLLGGFVVYQWVLASEATLASLVLLTFGIRYYRRDPRKSKWPPLLPLAVIGAAGGAKSFYVATGNETPFLVILILLAGVVWFGVSSWKIIRAARSVTT